MLAASEMELSFSAYQERQLHEISPAGVSARAAKLPAGDYQELLEAVRSYDQKLQLVLTAAIRSYDQKLQMVLTAAQ